MTSRLRSALLACFSVFLGSGLLSGCSTINYLLQAGHGQLSLIQHARPIGDVLKDVKTPTRVKRLLGEIDSIKAYSEKHQLKRTRNYTEYVKLDRPAAVWVVSASEELRFQSRDWKFPIVGSVPYLGWFDRASARSFASKLEQEGLDVDLRGAAAYSTLGWFHDPVLSTMLPEGDEALGDVVNVVIHESVHATFYIAGETYFNESLASFVADRLTLRYLTERYGLLSAELVAYQKAEAERVKRAERLQQVYSDLRGIYESSRSDDEKRQEKRRLIDAVAAEIGAKRPINNATLIQYKAYNTGMKEFGAIFERRCKESWECFWGVVGRLERKDFSETHQSDLAPVLEPLGG